MSFVPAFSGPLICHLYLSLAGAVAVTVVAVAGSEPAAPGVTVTSAIAGGAELGPSSAPPKSTTAYLPAGRLTVAAWLCPGGVAPMPPCARIQSGVLLLSPAVA